MHTLKEDLSERLSDVVGGVDVVLLVVELHVFLAGEVLAAIAVVPERVVEVIAQNADPISLAFVLLPQPSLRVFQRLLRASQSVHDPPLILNL